MMKNRIQIYFRRQQIANFYSSVDSDFSILSILVYKSKIGGKDLSNWNRIYSMKLAEVQI